MVQVSPQRNNAIFYYRMKVVLLKDVPKVGRRHDVKDLADGYARNFIIKNKLGELATPQLIARVKREKERMNAERHVREELLMKNMETLAGVVITLKEKANEQGHLFAAVHKPEVIAAVKDATRLLLDAEHLEMEKPIKTVGEHEVAFAVQDKRRKFKVIIEAKE